MGTRLAIVEDDPIQAELLSDTLKAEGYEVVTFPEGQSALVALEGGALIDVVLADVTMPGLDGLSLCAALMSSRPDLPVIVVTMHLDRAVAETAMQAGARGFVPKDSGLEELEVAIATVLAGGVHLSPRLPPSTNRMALRAAHAGLAQLTPRQHEIVRLIAEGRTSPEIAKWLGLSQRTVAFHRTNIRTKLGIDSERGLLRFALLTRMSNDGEDGESAPD